MTRGHIHPVCYLFLLLLLIWEFFSRTLPELLFVLPPPSHVLSALWECRSRLSFHATATLSEMGCGFILALACSFPLAWIMLRHKGSRLFLQPLFIIIQCLPMFALAPLMILWLGWNFLAIVIPTALMIFFPLTLNIYQGFRSTPTQLLDFFRLHQASEWQTFFKLHLPSALPQIFAGLRISAAISGVGALAGEWAGAQKGLGILMLESRRNADLEMTFAALFLLSLLSFLFYGFILLLEKGFLQERKKSSYLPKLSILLIFCILTPSCQQKESAHPETRLLLDWLPNPNHIPLYVGVEKNFFKEEQIELTIKKMSDTGGGISYLTSHQADLLLNHLPGTLRAASSGASLKIIGVMIKEPLNCIIYPKDPQVTQPSHLSGKILGYCIGGPDTAFLDFLLEEGGIQLEKKINVGSDLLSAIGTKRVDCIYGGYWNIEPSQLRMFNIETSYFKLHEFGVPNYYGLTIVANGNSKEASPTFIAHFQQALQKSLDFCKEHPEEAFQIYLKSNPDKRAKWLEWEKEAWQVTYPLLSSDQVIEADCLKNFYQFQQARGLYAHPFDYQSLLP